VLPAFGFLVASFNGLFLSWGPFATAGLGCTTFGAGFVVYTVVFFWVFCTTGFYVLVYAYFLALAISDYYFLVYFFVYFFYSGILSYPNTLKIN